VGRGREHRPSGPSSKSSLELGPMPVGCRVNPTGQAQIMHATCHYGSALIGSAPVAVT
jgi:hypothetical protein